MSDGPDDHAALTHDEVEESLALRNQVVLIVDDEPDIRDSIKELLDSALTGVKTITAESGQAALDILNTEHADLIITDYKMPGMNGLQFLAQARKIARNTPRILITAFPDLDLAIRAVNEENIENFFTKPLEPASVVEVIRGILYERRSSELRNRAFARSLDLLRKQLGEKR